MPKQTKAAEKAAEVAVAAAADADGGMRRLVMLLAEKVAMDEDRKTRDKRFANIEAKVEWAGTHIVLPDDPSRMTYVEAKKMLDRLEKDENEGVKIFEIVNAFPFDGAVAFMKALKEIYGWASPIPPKNFFESPPTMTSVDVAHNEKTMIIWGNFMVPGLQGYVQTSITMHEGRPVFCIQGETIKKHLPAVHELAELTRQIVDRESIYRGKAIRLLVAENGQINTREAPKFINTETVRPEELVFSEELTEQINTNLFTLIERTEHCRRHRVPLKRGVLLEGPYGTGKTLCANVVAQKCERNGWTFLTVERVSALKAALHFAALYQPCVIFVEDIDREVHGERTPQIDDILNTVDGIVSKGREIIIVLTSNNAEAINQAMMRPGRLDAVLHIDAPDADAAEKLMRIYGRGLIAPTTLLNVAKHELKGQIPAVIRECVERAKLYAISRSDDDDLIDIVDSDIAHAARGMRRHLELLRGKTPETETVEHQLGKYLIECVHKGMSNGGPEGLFAKVVRVEGDVAVIKEHVTG